MAPRRSSRANPLAFTPWPVTLITTLVYLALVIPVLVIHNVVPTPPRSNPKGLDIAEAWADLQYLTNGFHPYNSHRNDEVRDYLLQRIHEIVDDAPSPESYQSAGDEKPAVFVFDDLRSNLTFADGATGTGVYFEGTNIIVYVRGTDDDREHWWEDGDKEDAPSRGGVLVNAHYDSVSTGFGATDDGVGVVTCLQLLRYFTTPGHAPRRGLVVLLNNGEEDYLNGARVFSQHPISRLPRTFLNLEGAGAGTRAMLFRTTDEEVTRHYRRAPHPFGSVLSANGFDMRLIRSQTDYVVFNGDMGMRGLDVAFLEPRSRYHTDQDDARHTSKGSLWHMLSAAVGTTQGLVSDPSEQFDRPVQGGDGAGASGSKGVWFDLFGSPFVVFRLHTLFAISVTLLVVAPLVLLATGVALTRADKMYLFRSEARSPDRLEGVPLQGLRGFFRFPFLLAIPTVVTVGLAYLVTKINPYVINSSEYAVWSMMVAAWVFLAWFVSRVADFARPSAFHRVYTLTWMFAVYWVLLVVMTVYANRDGLAGGYFIFFSFAGVFVATWIGYLEMFALPRRSEYASLMHPPSRHTSTYGSRLGTAASGDDPETEHDDSDEEHVVEEEPTESTSLLGSGPRTTFANYVRVGHTDSHGDEAETGDPHVYGHEQPWSANLLQWSWAVQFLLVAPITLIMVGPLSLLLTSALHQTGPDGSSSLFIYIALASLTTFLLTPLLPFIHRFTHHIPVFLLAVFTGTLIYNLVAFPFSDSSRLKLFFIQELDLDTGSTRASLTGVAPFVQIAAKGLPSVHSTQNLTCDPVANRLQCSWPGPAPNVVDTTTPMQNWLHLNITKDDASSKSKSAHITLSGQNTRSCRLLFTRPIGSFSVHDSATDPARFPDGSSNSSSENGTKEIRLWSRTWNATWEVDVSWEKNDNGDDDEGQLEGRAVCIWSDGNKEGVIPALDEVRRFVPSWVAVSKLRDGLVEGGRGFTLS